MIHNAHDVVSYLNAIPEDRKREFSTLRNTILSTVPDGFEDGFYYGMVGYAVPHSLYPKGYHVDSKIPLPFCSIASQKNFIGFYHIGLYAIPEIKDWFIEEYAKRVAHKIDMGKSCIRFKKLNEIPFDLIGELMAKISVDDWIAQYESTFLKKG